MGQVTQVIRNKYVTLKKKCNKINKFIKKHSRK